MKQSYKKGETLKLFIEELAFGGQGVARDNDFVWFVEHGIPGQTVEAKIKSIKKNYGKSYVVNVLSDSPFQVEPECPMFGICGGCQFQNLDYDKQIEEKTRQIQELIERIGKFKEADVKSCIPAKKIYGYRNKMEFSFSARPWKLPDKEYSNQDSIALGLHAPRRFDRVIDLEGCPIMSETANKVFMSLKQEVLLSKFPAYDVITHAGFWRTLAIRQGMNTEQLMINLITSSEDIKNRENEVRKTAEAVLKMHPEITTFIHSINDNVADIALGKTKTIFSGNGKITEEINRKIFEISPNSFFQTNTFQAEILFKIIKELSGLTGNEIVYDLYCGTGAIGISIADNAKLVLGIEIVKDAVDNGAINVELNKLSNVHFVLADMRDAMGQIHKFVDHYGMADVVIMDPPRAGTHPKSIKGLLNLYPEKIVYVSCNPAILARDIEILCAKHYNLTTVQPVDMFPHTKHVEVVALFEKKQL
ncbi:23S rRNA (uracil(1939)-C(5))-methyltransferase RlmD [bacterium]|nr:23S rRNA (uracil(1939)-C(5))-methyltransferase RlmD [bacterium]